MYDNRTLRLTVISAAVLLFLAACTTPGTGEISRSEGRVPEAKGPGESSTPDIPDETPENASDLLVSFYDGTEDVAPALEVLEKSDVQNMDESSRLVYAVLLRTQGRLDDSRAVLEQILSENPDFADAWFNLALLEHAAGNSEARDTALDTTLNLDRTFSEAYAFRGSIALSRSDKDVAEKSFKSALQYNPESAESLIGLAWLMAKSEREEQALPLLDRAVDLDPDFVYARVDRSRVNVALRNYNAAEDDLDIAIEKEPDVPWHYLDRARIRLRHFKDYEGAREDLEMVEKLDPGNFFALVYLAGLHDEERRFSTAMDYYERVVELRPDYVWAYMPLGKLSWMTGDYQASREWYLKAAAEDPEEFSFLLMAALASRRAGDERESAKILADVLRKFKQGETAYEVVRFCAERSTDYYAINALNKEENEILRERLWFYMGATYEFSGNKASANAVFTRLAPQHGEMEYDLAWAALNGMGGADE